MLRIFALSLGLVAVTCSSSSSTQQPPDERPDQPDKQELPSEGDAGPSDAGPAVGGADSSVVGGERPGLELPSGALCDTTADCGDKEVCEGVGCGPRQGRCVSSERMCTRDLAEYCGCDGKTFTGSGSCPGGRYAHRGACTPNREDGEPCSDGRQCRSGQCVGEGLEGCMKSAQGVCGAAECTVDLAAYCGCNNTTMQASGSCPNQQFAYRGPCEDG